jgi:two-component system LytT family response regulator
MNQNLDELMSQLNPKKFFRANRQYIIAHEAVKDISIWFGNKISINLTVPTEEKIIVSKARVSEFKNWYSF